MKFLKNPYILAVLSALLLRAAYPKFDAWPLALIAFWPLLTALEGRRPFQGFLIAFTAGIVFFLTSIFWLIHVTILGMVILSVYLALYSGFFGLGFCSLKDKLGPGGRLVFVPALWEMLEFTRRHLMTGFTWALLAYSQDLDLAGIQGADLTGAYGVSFMVMFVNVLFFEAGRMVRAKAGSRPRPILIALAVVIAWVGYGIFRLQQDPGRGEPAKVAVIQGNIAQEIKWVPQFQEGIFSKYRLLSEIAALKETPDLIVWPETSLPDYFESGINDGPLRELAGSLGTALLVGSIRLDGAKYYNSAILFSGSGEVEGIYDKLHLVPFGEYIPLRRAIPFLEKLLPIEDFTAGRDPKVFALPGRGTPPWRFGVLICFEDIFSERARSLAERGADVLINMTNDAWFGDTVSPYQHQQASVFRAVENRAPLVRAANTGISCFIDDTGAVKKTVEDNHGKPTFVTGHAAALVAPTRRRSLYTSIGDLFALLCVLYAGTAVLFSRRMQRHGS